MDAFQNAALVTVVALAGFVVLLMHATREPRESGVESSRPIWSVPNPLFDADEWAVATNPLFEPETADGIFARCVLT
jgi:hypothetical protein